MESGRVNDDLFPRMASSSSLLKRALTTNTLNSPSERKMVVKMRKKKKSALNRDVGEKKAVLRTRVSFRHVRCVANASELARAAVSCAIRFKVVERVLMKNKMKIYLNCNILETKWSILVNRVNGTFSIIVRHSFQGIGHVLMKNELKIYNTALT